MQTPTPEFWAKKALEIRAKRDAQVEEFISTYAQTMDLSEEEQKSILMKDIGQLRTMVISEEITVSKLLVVFLLRALTVGHQLGALADINTEEAMARAKELEGILANTKPENRDKDLGLLFGVPLSIKDCIRLKNYIASIGLTALALKKQEGNSNLIKLILKHGAVPLVKSNVPMLT